MRIRFVVATAAVALVAGYVLGTAEGELPFSKSDIASAEKLVGLEFTEAERDSMQTDLADYRTGYITMRATPIPNAVPPALVMHLASAPPSTDPGARPRWSKVGKVTRPDHLEDVAFWSVRDLGELLRTKQVTSVELTTMYLERLKRYGPTLECVVSLTEARALEAARRADAEIARGKYRGPLHGIPYGAKDLLAVKGTKTTWGATPFKDQVIDDTATVIRKLDDAGAVLVVKTHAGRTRVGRCVVRRHDAQSVEYGEGFEWFIGRVCLRHGGRAGCRSRSGPRRGVRSCRHRPCAVPRVCGRRSGA